jgi:hypothetical protein
VNMVMNLWVPYVAGQGPVASQERFCSIELVNCLVD